MSRQTECVSDAPSDNIVLENLGNTPAANLLELKHPSSEFVSCAPDGALQVQSESGDFWRLSPVLTRDGAFCANKIIVGVVGQSRPVRVPGVPIVEAVDSDRVGEGDEGQLAVAKGGHCPGWRQR